MIARDCFPSETVFPLCCRSTLRCFLSENAPSSAAVFHVVPVLHFSVFCDNIRSKSRKTKPAGLLLCRLLCVKCVILFRSLLQTLPLPSDCFCRQVLFNQFLSRVATVNSPDRFPAPGPDLQQLSSRPSPRRDGLWLDSPAKGERALCLGSFLYLCEEVLLWL